MSEGDRPRVNTYYVSPAGSGWKVTHEDGTVLGIHPNRDAAVEAAKIAAQANEPSQVMVPTPEGGFRMEWTYGYDPYAP